MTDSTVPNGGSVTKFVVNDPPANIDPGPIRFEPNTAGAKVYCVICCGAEPTGDLVHIFSTQENATAFANADRERNHVLYDYVIDCPERMEGPAQ